MSEQSQLGASRDGTVVLDIGGDIGALVLMVPADLLGAEIEISPLDPAAGDVFQGMHRHASEHEHGAGTHTHGDRTHVAVRERLGPAGVRYAAIYPGLLAGEYQLWNVDGSPADIVRIVGGEVAELVWR